MLGMRLAESGQAVEVLAVGDSLAYHVRGGALISTFPYSAAEEFDALSALLSTLGNKNGFLAEAGFFAHNLRATWAVRSSALRARTTPRTASATSCAR